MGNGSYNRVYDWENIFFLSDKAMATLHTRGPTSLIELSVLALQGDLGNELVVRSSMCLALQSTRQIILFSPHELARSQRSFVWLTLSSGFVNLWLLQSSAPMYGVPWLGGNLAE